jgi:hypothetical protein
MRVSIESIFETTAIALYDLDLPIEERSKNKKVFKKASDCVRFLGSSLSKFSHAKSSPSGRITDKSGKQYAIRNIDYEKYLKEIGK